ncbi:MAG: hypothetical protein RLZ72_917 [Actinomycetota bacterium]|jgi:hypothetical protein
MNFSIRVGIAFALCISTSITVGTFATPAFAATKYKNCTALNRVYPHGVAHTGYSERGGGLTGRPKVSNAIYNANSSKDRDHDGVACER